MPIRDILLALLVPVVWGVCFTLAKPASEHFPQLFMIGVIYCVLAVLFRLIYRGPYATPLGSAALIALTAGSLQSLLLFMGLAMLDASVAVLVLQLQVPLAVLTGWALNGEQIAPARLIGIAIAFLGVVAVIGLPEQTPSILAAGIIIVSSVFWASGQALIRRFGRDDAPRMLAIVAMHAGPQMLLGSLLLEHDQLEAVRSAGAAQWGSFVLLMVGGYALGNLLWYSLLKRRRLDEISPFLLLMPVVGVGVSALVLGETITSGHLIGGAIILLGLAIVSGVGRQADTRQQPASREAAP